MITLQEVKKQIDDLTDVRNINSMDKKEKTKARKEVQFLQLIRKYLESSPTRTFIQKELDRIRNRVDAIMGLFSHSELLDKPTVNKMRKEYEKNNDVPKLRTQVRALKFLLKK